MWRQRSLWIALGVVLYVGAAALHNQPDSRLVAGAVVLAPLFVLLGWRWTAIPARGIDHIDALARRAARLCIAGVGLRIVTELAPATPGLTVAGVVGAGLACVSAPVAVSSLSSLGGVAAVPPRRRYDAATVCALLWLIALGLAASPILAPARAALLDPAALAYAEVAASLGSAAIILLTAYRVYALRRYELGVAERAAAALWLGVLCMALGVFSALMAVAPAERAVPPAATVTSLLVCAAAVSQRPARLSRAMRLAVSLTLLCVPLLCVAVIAAYKAPPLVGVILFAVTLLAALMGLLAPRLGQLLAPERGHGLVVLAEALRAAKTPDPRQALPAVLRAIHDGLKTSQFEASLVQLASGDRVTIDRAGYVHSATLNLPDELLEIAANEPEQVLSTEALRYIQVRRPDVRKLVAWLDQQDCGAVAVVRDEEMSVGLLLWPAAGRSTPLSYEEVKLLARLAGHLGSAAGAEAQLARSRKRELEAQAALRDAQQHADALDDMLQRRARRHHAQARWMARPAQDAHYSPTATVAFQELERVAAHHAVIGLLAPVGIDATAWAAVAHLASERSDGPLLVVDGHSTAEQALALWTDEATSPLSVCRGGTLVLLAAHVLPHDTQRYIANALPPDVGLVLVLPPATLRQEMTFEGRNPALEAHMGEKLGVQQLRLPALVDRAEDLRALALLSLTRIGMHLRGEPYGLSLDAQLLLNEHDWPGNDAELEAVLLRAALASKGNVVGARELVRALGLSRQLSDRSAHLDGLIGDRAG